MRPRTILIWSAVLMSLSLIIFGCKDEKTPTEPQGNRIIVVKADGSGDYLTIQEAIDAAAEGDTVALYDGTYIGEGNRDVEYRGKAVTVMSQSGSPEDCVIDCQGAGRGFYFHMQEGSESVLMGVKVINGQSASGGGVICTDVSSPTIVNCIFADNDGPEAGGGMQIHDQSNPALSDCIFWDNTVTQGAGGGVYISDSAPTFSNCTFAGNSANQGGGLAIYNSSATLINCTIVGNQPDGIDCGDSDPQVISTIVAFNFVGVGVGCADNCDIYLDCCDIFGNAGGDSTDCVVDQFGLRGNISEDPRFCDMTLGDYRLQPGSPCNASCGIMGAWLMGCD